MQFKILIASLLLSATGAIQLQAKSTTSILQSLADGDDKKGDLDDNSTDTANITETFCGMEGEFCECDGDIEFGALKKRDHSLNHKKNISVKNPNGADGLECSNNVFGDPVPGVVKGCFCTNANVTKKNATDHDSDMVIEPVTYAQIKLIGNNDGRTVMINTTERNITATISTHLDLNNLKAKKRPAGNGRNKKQKYAFVQDNGDAKQKWKKETHPSVPGAFRLVDETNYCLWANNPQDFKRHKSSAFVTVVPGQKKKCTFWELKQAGDGWNIVMARPGLKQGQGKYSNMNGWGLMVAGWCKKGDCSLGPDQMYLVLHKKAKKHSIWTSAIFNPPANVTEALLSNKTLHNDTEVEPEDNDTADSNDTGNATDTAPATATPAGAAAPAPAAATPAGAAAPAGNSTNGTNSTKKKSKKKPKKKKLPVPYAGDDSDDDAEGDDLSYDIDDEEDFEGLEMREKVEKATVMHGLPVGFVHVKWLKWLKLFDDDE